MRATAPAAQRLRSTSRSSTTATAASTVSDDDVRRSFDQLTLAAAVLRRIIHPERRLSVDEHRRGALLRLPHVRAAAHRVDAHVIDTKRGPTIDENVR